VIRISLKGQAGQGPNVGGPKRQGLINFGGIGIYSIFVSLVNWARKSYLTYSVRSHLTALLYDKKILHDGGKRMMESVLEEFSAEMLKLYDFLIQASAWKVVWLKIVSHVC